MKPISLIMAAFRSLSRRAQVGCILTGSGCSIAGYYYYYTYKKNITPIVNSKSPSVTNNKVNNNESKLETEISNVNTNRTVNDQRSVIKTDNESENEMKNESENESQTEMEQMDLNSDESQESQETVQSVGHDIVLGTFGVLFVAAQVALFYIIKGDL